MLGAAKKTKAIEVEIFVASLASRRKGFLTLSLPVVSRQWKQTAFALKLIACALTD